MCVHFIWAVLCPETRLSDRTHLVSWPSDSSSLMSVIVCLVLLLRVCLLFKCRPDREVSCCCTLPLQDPWLRALTSPYSYSFPNHANVQLSARQRHEVTVECLHAAVCVCVECHEWTTAACDEKLKMSAACEMMFRWQKDECQERESNARVSAYMSELW